MKRKIAVITGINGQDGSFLAELLLLKNYEVHGIIRKTSHTNTQKISNILQNIQLHFGDLTDASLIETIIAKIKPDEIYHLGAQSQVRDSFDMPIYTCEVNAMGTLHLLEAMRKHCPKAKLYNACTSELYGKIESPTQDEKTAFHPRSPYAVSKMFSFWICKNYKESYNLFTCNGILFNHESERRGSTFVTKKVTEGLVEYNRTGKPFYLGNLHAKRDWGYAQDYVEGMWMMLQQNKADDYVLATSENHTIKEFINECLKHMPDNSRYEWKLDEERRDILWDMEAWKLVIGINPKFYRAAEVDVLLGDYSKAKKELGWEPKIKFKELAEIMIKHELNNYGKEF
jgi:GDPmannose 4,6-dehydratase